jgi:hypothetical protein
MSEYLSDASNLNPLFQRTLLTTGGSSSQEEPVSGVENLLDRLPRGVKQGLDRAYGQYDKYAFGGLLPGGAESIRGKLKRPLDDRAYSLYDKYVFGGFLPGGAESIRGKLNSKLDIDPDPDPVSVTEAEKTPSETSIEGQQKAPGYDSTPTSDALGQIFDIYQQQLEQANQQNQVLTSPGFLDDASRRRKEELAYATNLLSKAQMGQMREKTRRDVLDGWRKIQQEKIRANTVMATALMNTSILAATPNTGVIQALSGPTQAAIQAFRPGQAVN